MASLAGFRTWLLHILKWWGYTRIHHPRQQLQMRTAPSYLVWSGSRHEILFIPSAVCFKRFWCIQGPELCIYRIFCALSQGLVFISVTSESFKIALVQCMRKDSYFADSTNLQQGFYWPINEASRPDLSKIGHQQTDFTLFLIHLNTIG